MTPDEELSTRCSDGIFTLGDAIACGFAPDTVRKRLARGLWRELTTGVYASMTTPLPVTTWERGLMRSFRGRMALSHLSAARAWDIPVPAADERAWMTVDKATRWVLPDSIRPVRTRHMPPTWSRDGLDLTPPARTVVDLAMCLDRRALRWAVGDVLQRRLTLLSRIQVETNRLTRRTGHTMLRGVLREFDEGFETELESHLGEGMARRGIVGFEPQYVVRGRDGRILARYDFADLRMRVGLECDGWASHGSAEQQAADRRRDRRTAGVGWSTLRYGPEEIFHNLEVTLDEIELIQQSRLAS